MGVDWWTPAGQLSGAIMDELYLFMTMRVRVVEHEPGVRPVAYVERWSLPLALRMVQLIETYVLPSGQTDGSELGRHFLLIGRLRKNGNRCEVDGNFIPPCTSMSSHPDLKGYYT